MNPYEEKYAKLLRLSEESRKAADRSAAEHHQKRIEAGAYPSFPLLFLADDGIGNAIDLAEDDYDLLIEAGVSRRSHGVLAAATRILWNADDEEPRSRTQLIDPENLRPGVVANANQRRAMSALLKMGRLKKVGAARSTAYLLAPYDEP